MDKYVAFLDVLGFTDKAENMSHDDMVKYIKNFSNTVFGIWEKRGLSYLKGYVVSDSVIIYTDGVSLDALNELLDLTVAICKKEFVENGILLRCAVAKGEFDKIDVKELASLKKGLIVGKAYIEAYKLEGKAKHSGIALSKSVFEDIKELGKYSGNIFEENDCCYLRYLTLSFLIEGDNIEKFVDLAVEAKWLPHYYNTLYFALKGNDNDRMTLALFYIILTRIIDNNMGKNWRKVDVFLKNVFVDDVAQEFQTKFLKCLRKCIESQF